MVNASNELMNLIYVFKDEPGINLRYLLYREMRERVKVSWGNKKGRQMAAFYYLLCKLMYFAEFAYLAN